MNYMIIHRRKIAQFLDFTNFTSLQPLTIRLFFRQEIYWFEIMKSNLLINNTHIEIQLYMVKFLMTSL